MGRGRPRVNGGACSTPGCAGRAKAKGWCSACYGRWWRTGTTAKQAAKRLQAPGQDPRESAETRARKRAEAEEHYNNAVGVPALRFWRAQIDALA